MSQAYSFYSAAIPVQRYLPRPSPLSPTLLLDVLHTPRTLSAFVASIDWPDLYSLLSTCSSLRSALFAHVPTRDVVLSRFVPGFFFCLRHRDLQFYQDVPVTIHDLDMLLISQRTDLHRYPTHALRSLTAPTIDAHSTTKLIKLAQAHSRFVLLFQSLVHSSTLPIPPDPPEDKSPLKPQDPSPLLTFPAPLAFADESPPPLPPKDLPQPSSRKKHKHSYSFSRHSIARKHSASPYIIAPSKLTHPPLSHPNNSTDSHLPPSKSLPARNSTNRCLSLFCLQDPSPAPPPPELPETLRIRSKEWRRARSASIISPTNSLPTRRPPLSSFNGHLRGYNSSSIDFPFDFDSAYPSDTEFEFGQLRRPKRLFAAEGNKINNLASSSSSSISISETRSSWNQGQGSISSSRSSPPISPHGYTHPRFPYHRTGNNTNYLNPPFAPSIHSLLHATIRNRAPILRVFVPTQHMQSPVQTPQSSLNSSPERSQTEKNQLTPQSLASIAIQACESQLQEAGLWDHLSTGDVICNFGYIPLDDDLSSSFDVVPPSDSVYTPKVLSPSHRPSLRSITMYPPPPQPQPPRKTWLIFTGHSLLPYTPPSLLPLPSSSPLSLPSPFYYYHILPVGTNPLFEIPQLPPPATPSGISLALIKTTSLIPSTISHTGFAKVNKFAWTGRVVRTRHTPTQPQMSTKNPFAPPQPVVVNPSEQLGDGWLGEWIIEYEGTSEGRELLLAALEGKVLRKKKGKEDEKGEGEEKKGRVWEVRRERSGGGRVWMRLLPE